VTTVQGWFDTFLTEFSADVGQAVLLHENPATPPTVITDLIVAGQIATQRRRMR
jgi:hypothetical protein